MLADAVPEVENMCRAGPVRLVFRGFVGCSEALQHLGHLGLNLRAVGKQHIGVDIALQGLARAATVPADQGAGVRQVHCPVQPQYIAVQLAHFFQPRAASLGEHDARNHRAFVLTLELAQHPRRVGQAELLERPVGQYAPPSYRTPSRPGHRPRSARSDTPPRHRR